MMELTIEEIPNIELKSKFTGSIESLGFGRIFTDRMFVKKFQNGVWGENSIKKYEPISIDPSAVCLHYGQTIFEGMKAFKTPKGDLR